MIESDESHQSGMPREGTPSGLPGSPEPAGALPPEADTLDPLGINKAARQVWESMATNPAAFVQSQVQFANAWVEIAARTLGAFASPAEAPLPVVEPAPNDNRWKHEAWTENPTFSAIKQGYLLATRAVLDSIDLAPDVDAETKARVKYFAKQFCDAMSPTNFAWLNPAVIEETLKTGGRNLEKGAQNVADDLRENEGRPALVNKAAFQVGKNVATSKGEVVFRNELIELIQYTPATPTVFERPLLIVPPWINKYYILDLQPANSFIRYATDNGLHTFVVSWRNPDTSLAHLTFDDYLDLGAVKAATVARDIARSEDVNQIGYCLGGTLTAMELASFAQEQNRLVNAVTQFAALVDFADAGDIKNFLAPEAVAFIEKRMDEKGILPASDMSDTFNLLRANDLIWNVAVNRYLLGKDAPAFDLLYWNSDSTRMPAVMHKFYLENMYVRNALAKGELEVKGKRIDLHDVKNDVYCVSTIEDHIAPWRSVYKTTQLFGGDVRFRLAHSGHIAGIINAPGSGKGHYWASAQNPPAADDWFAGAEKHRGSWWPDWLAWITDRSGERVAAPERLGSDAYAPLVAAPGTYVLETA